MNPNNAKDRTSRGLPLRGADALVQALQRAGIRHVFALSGNHIMSVFDALQGSGIQLIHTRHEAAAVHMADAWARLTGEVGIALVTGGPGHANALSALYTAQMAESPLVLLSGHAANAQLGHGAFQEMRQADMAAPITKAAWTCASAAVLASDMARAMQLARSGRAGPVHLSLPSDTLDSLAAGSTMPDASAFAAMAMPLAAEQAPAMLAQLRRAKRPLILTGPASLTRDRRALCAQLEAACGVPVIGMESPRGLNDPALGALAEVLKQADAVLLIGKRLDFTLQFGRAPAFRDDAQWLQIDADLSEMARSRQAVGARLIASAQADIDSALPALLQAATSLTEHAAPGHQAWLQTVQQALAYRPASWAQACANQADRLHPVQALAPLQSLLDSHPQAVLISDGGEFGQWAQACLQAPHRLVNGVAGAIGSALPFALAARLAVPQAPVLAVSGDGSIGFHIAEFDTAVRHQLPFVTLIGNDARWNAEHQIQLKDYGADRLMGCELLPTRYDQVATAFGGYGEQVTKAAELMPAVQRALASGLPADRKSVV